MPTTEQVMTDGRTMTVLVPVNADLLEGVLVSFPMTNEEIEAIGDGTAAYLAELQESVGPDNRIALGVVRGTPGQIISLLQEMQSVAGAAISQMIDGDPEPAVPGNPEEVH